jgi:hypothetical protein
MKKDDVRSTPERVSCIGACIILVLCVLIGCSSSDSSQRHGIFVDSAVEGITFKTETKSGETDSKGRFIYEPGETVTFSIGGIILGTTTAKPTITPVDLVERAQDENDPAVTNITRLLISLDEDNDPDNGITISPELRAVLADISVDFNQDTSLFAQDAPILEVMKLVNKLNNTAESQERTICSVQDAQDHLRNTIDALLKNGYEKPSGSGGNGGGNGGGGGGSGGCG